MNTLSVKQKKAWNRQNIYVGHSYRVEINKDEICGFFNSRCGEYTSRFEVMGYSPEKGGEIEIFGDNSGDFLPVPGFCHPNDLYNWLREFFGYEKSLILKER